MVAAVRVVEDGGTLYERELVMSSTKALEYRITERLIGKRRIPPGGDNRRLAEFVIRGLAVVAVAVLVGVHLPELLWAGIAASVVYTLGLE